MSLCAAALERRQRPVSPAHGLKGVLFLHVNIYEKENNSCVQVIWLPASPKMVCSATAATEEHSTSLSCVPGLYFRFSGANRW